MKTNTLISIIIPVYNAELHLSETIESVMAQTYQNWELILVDDESTDRSKIIALNYQAQNIIVFSKKNGGAAAARNYGYARSNGQFIKFLDADDLIDPKMLENQIRLAVTHEGCLVSSKWGRFYHNDVETFQLNPEDCWQNLSGIDWICSSWKNGASMTQPGIFLIPKSLLVQAGQWNTKLSLVDDFEFFTRIILAAKGVVFSEKSTLYYRSGLSNSLSGLKSRKGAESELLAVQLATAEVLTKERSARTLKICALAFANFIFNYYPNHAELLEIATKEYNLLTDLKLSKIAPRGGLIENILGWKTTKYLKKIKNGLFNA